MKKIVLFLLVISSFVYAKVNTVVSILPQKTFVEAIGGDKVNVSLMVKPGDSPHTYEPKPSQMIDIAKAKLYFSIGIEFEEVWLPKFASQNKKLKIVNIAKGIQKIEMAEHHHHDEHGHEKHGHHEHDHDKHKDHGHHDHGHHDHDHGGLDPHVWLSPKETKILAKNILKYLVKVDRKNEAYYEANYNKFISHVEATDKKIKDILKDTPKGAKFMVFHPAWGYFAKEYNLEQMAIEVSGKKPKPKQIAHLIEEAKEEKIKAIFTAPEFSDKVAKQIANELNIKVIGLSPLNPKWSENLINFAKAIANE